MKTLTLLRHAKSSWGNPAIEDFDRPLNERGIAAAARMGRELRDLGMTFDRILASPARRVVETIELLAEGYGQTLSPHFDQRLYAASSDLLLDVVRSTDDRVSRLLMVGHNPGLERLAIALTADDKRGDRQRLAMKFPTAAWAEISLPIDHWRDAGSVAATITRFVQPRDLAAE